MTVATPIQDVLADAEHPAHEIAKEVLDKLASGELNLCACMGPMYGEPECPCLMDRLGLPKNELAREADRKQFEDGITKMLRPNNDG